MAATARALSWPQRAVALLLPAILGLPLLLGLAARLVPALEARPLYHEATPPRPPAPRWATLADRSFQAGLETWFAERLPPRRPAIELANQLYYDLFRRSYMYGENIVVGQGRTLFERFYIQAWCRSTADPAALGRLVDRIAALRDRFARDGRVLLFLVTPSKAVVMPELMPEACPPPADPDLPRRTLLALLRARRIPLIDGHAAVVEMKRDDPLPPFPQGGTHWSRLAAARVAGALLAAAGRLAGADLGGLSVSDIGWQAAPTPPDDDLALLLNLHDPPVHFPVGAGHEACRTTAAGQSAELVAVGGSFLHLPLSAIAECRLLARIDYFFYYDQFRLAPPSEERHPVERAQIDWKSRLARTRLLLLEANEQQIESGAPHLDRFLDDALPQLR
jgi:hypothetical protein